MEEEEEGEVDRVKLVEDGRLSDLPYIQAVR